MVARVRTVAFQGIETLAIDVQVQLSAGLPNFVIVGLPDKAVAESRERVRGAFVAMGLALPSKRVTVNLAPADVQKEGSHYDLPIAVGLLTAMGLLPPEEIACYTVLGELGLDGSVAPVAGVLPAAVAANADERGLICPAAQGGEAAWAGGGDILATPSLLALVNHFKGSQILRLPEARISNNTPFLLDLRDVKGQESAKRALEVAASGGHNLLMNGPPGSGKSMLAARLPGLLPPLSAEEALETSMIHSLSATLPADGLIRHRPFRTPHHSASLPSLIGGGTRARPGEVSLAHNGILFLDELPEFQRAALEALRQPLETGRAVIARAAAHVSYPARFQLVAAMNPCRCGYLNDASQACTRAPKCAEDYQSRLSGPFLDRIDLFVEVPPVDPLDLSIPPSSEGTEDVAARVARARMIQEQRYRSEPGNIRTNALADGILLERIAAPDAAGRALLQDAAARFGLSARAYHRVLRVARTLADLDGGGPVRRIQIAEALAFRRSRPGQRR